MEILIHIIIAILEFFAELILQVFFEVLVEFGLHSVKEPFRLPQPNPWIASFGYITFGVLAGAISLYFFPDYFISSEIGRIANLIITPLMAGLSMSILGAWRRNRGQEVIRIDRFFYGYLFALSMALVRFVFSGY